MEKNKKFHQKKLTDGVLNFEHHETTCSYVLRDENIFLNGESFGSRLFEVAHKKNADINSVLEIGAGLGYLAKKFIAKQAKTSKKKLNYTIFDLSPELIKNQKTLLKKEKVNWIEGDALNISKAIKSKQFDLVIANEMLADLPVGILESDLTEIESKKLSLNVLQPKTVASFQKDYKEKVLIPVGLLKMLRGLRKLCHSSTQILLSEYFTRHGGGSIVPLHNHEEYRLNLNLTAELIRNEGFNVQVVSLIDYLDLNLNAKPLSKELTKFFSSHLKLLESRTAPLGVKDLSDFKLSNNSFCRADWLAVFSNYYFLIISPRKSVLSMAEALNLKICKNEDVSLVKNKSSSLLILNHPAKAISLSVQEKKLWEKIKKDIPVKKVVAGDLSTWIFLKKLEANHFISFQ